MGSPAASRSPSALDTPAGDLPLAVWPCANTSPQYQRAGRYLPASTAHPAKMTPELARRILAAYSQPGQLVADPLCGIGTTLVEAAALGRRAVGVELEPRWAELARANLTHALPPPQATLAEVRVGDARLLPQVLADLAGTVDLVATSPPYACDVGMIDKPAWLAGRTLCRRDTLNYSTDHANLGHARGDRYLAELARVYTGCFELLRPGGLLVTVTKNLRRRGRVHDLATVTVELATQAGFQYLQHVVALLAAVRDGRLHARPSFWQLTQTRKARARGQPAHLVVHEDVLVFARRGLAAPTLPPRAGQLGPQDGHPALGRGAATPSRRDRTRSRGSGRREQG
jgi:modification methylase